MVYVSRPSTVIQAFLIWESDLFFCGFSSFTTHTHDSSHSPYFPTLKKIVSEVCLREHRAFGHSSVSQLIVCVHNLAFLSHNQPRVLSQFIRTNKQTTTHSVSWISSFASHTQRLLTAWSVCTLHIFATVVPSFSVYIFLIFLFYKHLPGICIPQACSLTCHFYTAYTLPPTPRFCP